jgi:hypothetical protein
MSKTSYVKTEEWKPNHAPLDYPKEFVDFVDSINLKGWQNMIRYEKYELYKKQAKQWVDENDKIENYFEKEDQEDYILQEYMRCKDNTLYFANKYGWLKEGSVAGGKMKYKAWEAQMLILFLLDSGYNCMIGKARQIGFTTTLMLACMARLLFYPSYYTKFVTHSKEKGEEIFRDKLKWGFGHVPEWLKRGVGTDTKTTLSLHEKSGKNKGQTKGAHSRAEVVAPHVDAINGGSPQITMIDEIGLFDIFGQMMSEGRPTLFYYDPETKRQVMRRQFFAWGTGGEMEKGGAAFESEFKAALDAWEKRKFSYAVIPLFFNAWAREGMSENMLKAEKEVYYSKTGIDKEKFKVQFHQHYPLSIDDMFLRNARTLMPIDQCNKHILKIMHLKPVDQPQYGYFEPIFDTTHPTPDLELPYKVIGAEWVPTKGMEDERTTTCIFKHPEQGWENRYWQGTDPINSETGHSKMSSSIWDAHAETCPAVVFHRVRQFKECYLQCLLLGLYYEVNTGCKELVEQNIGDSYVEWQDTRGFGRRIQPQSMLPKYLHAGSKWWGINNKTNTAGKIINKLIEMIDSHANNIYIPWFFLQMKTFIEKDLNSKSSGRETRYQAADLRYDWDDVIFSMVFAYINAECNRHFFPKYTGDKTVGKKRSKTRYIQDARTNWVQRLAEVDDEGKFIRFINNY